MFDVIGSPESRTRMEAQWAELGLSPAGAGRGARDLRWLPDVPRAYWDANNFIYWLNAAAVPNFLPHRRSRLPKIFSPPRGICAKRAS